MTRASTDRARDASVYRKAARIIERHSGLSCVKICQARRLEYSQDDPYVKRYFDLYELEKNHIHLTDGKDHRVVLLCFMAAMVEAGDA